MRKALIALFAMCSFVLTCGLLGAGAPAKPQEEAAPFISQDGGQNGSVVIGHIKTRDRVVTILKTAEGSRYTVKTSDGRTLDARINGEEFKARYPLLHDQMENGRAEIDAGLRINSSTIKNIQRERLMNR
jgi:hypothetical protein